MSFTDIERVLKLTTYCLLFNRKCDDKGFVSSLHGDVSSLRTTNYYHYISVISWVTQEHHIEDIFDCGLIESSDAEKLLEHFGNSATKTSFAFGCN